MFKLLVIVFMIIMGIYYVDIISKLLKDDKQAGPAKYGGCKAMIPFAYWIAPVKEKKKRRKKKNVKSKKSETDEKRKTESKN